MRDENVSAAMVWRAAWVNRIFGSWAAYQASLPEREWVRGDNGWYSRAR